MGNSHLLPLRGIKLNNHSVKIMQCGFGIFLFSILSFPSYASYYLQLGAFKSQSNAQDFYMKAQAKISQAISINKSASHGVTLYYVQAGPFDDIHEANRVKRLASQAQMSSLIISRKNTSDHPPPQKASNKLAPRTDKQVVALKQVKPSVSQNIAVKNKARDEIDNQYAIAFIKDSYYIQLGEFNEKSKAKMVYEQASSTLNFPVLLNEKQKQGVTHYYVQIGPFADLDEAISYRRMTSNELKTISTLEHMRTPSDPSSSSKQQVIPSETKANQRTKRKSGRTVAKIAQFKNLFG